MTPIDFAYPETQDRATDVEYLIASFGTIYYPGFVREVKRKVRDSTMPGEYATFVDAREIGKWDPDSDRGAEVFEKGVQTAVAKAVKFGMASVFCREGKRHSVRVARNAARRLAERTGHPVRLKHYSLRCYIGTDGRERWREPQEEVMRPSSEQQVQLREEL